MPRNNHIKKLIAYKQARLQKLKEKQALSGLSVAPEILIEIEILEPELEKLQVELESLAKDNDVAEAQLSQEQSKPEPWHILIVDDDSNWQKRLNRTLREINCFVIEASNYDEAARALTNSNLRLDLVTIDLTLDTESEGLDLISHIRETVGLHFPIIVVTGEGDLERQRRAFKEYKVIDFIEKAKFESKEFKNIVIKSISDMGP